MKIAFVNDIHIGKPLPGGSGVRASSDKAAGYLPKVFEAITVHKPDLLVDLGDLIRSESVAVDTENLHQALNLFTNVALPTLHLAGNHELKKLAVRDIEGLWKDFGINQTSFGSRKLYDFNLIWLGFEQEVSEKGIDSYLPDEQLKWLELELTSNNNPTLILTHYDLSGQNLDGNFYFEKPKDSFARYSNSKVVNELLAKHQQVLAVFSAHVHWLGCKLIGAIPYFTLPAMVENIAAPEAVDNFPEIYSIVTIERNVLTVKCFSREYCFASLEMPLLK